MTIQETLIDVINEFPKSKYGLLSKLADELNDKMLWEIANADYGCAADECFEILKNIQLTKEMPDTVSFDLNEVVSLTRWLEAVTREEHLMRAFSCVCLLIEETMIGSFAYSMGMSEGALAGLIDSVMFLGNDYVELTNQFINWRVFHDIENEEASYDDDCEPYTLDELYINDLFITMWLYCLLLEKKEEVVIIILVDWLFQEATSTTDLYKLTLLIKESFASVKPKLWLTINQNILTFINENYQTDDIFHKLSVFINAILSNDITEIIKVRKENGINI